MHLRQHVQRPKRRLVRMCAVEVAVDVSYCAFAPFTLSLRDFSVIVVAVVVPILCCIGILVLCCLCPACCLYGVLRKNRNSGGAVMQMQVKGAHLPTFLQATKLQPVYTTNAAAPPRYLA